VKTNPKYDKAQQQLPVLREEWAQLNAVLRMPRERLAKDADADRPAFTGKAYREAVKVFESSELRRDFAARQKAETRYWKIDAKIERLECMCADGRLSPMESDEPADDEYPS
jgi:hypothetical protein